MLNADCWMTLIEGARERAHSAFRNQRFSNFSIYFVPALVGAS
jgi:hypothetical protein